jgi:hypothetical protein
VIRVPKVDFTPFGARQCRGCGLLLLARDRCACDTATVHVITTLGPTDGPGLVVPAQLAGAGHGFGDMPMWRFDPWRNA